MLGEPLTVYGSGGQTRGIIDIRDTVECIRLAVTHPAEPGEFRVFNQLTEQMSVHEMAKAIAAAFPGAAEVENVENPRVEADSHHYNVVFTGLASLGLQPHLLSDTLITSLFPIVERHRERVDRAMLAPTVRWRNPSNPLR